MVNKHKVKYSCKGMFVCFTSASVWKDLVLIERVCLKQTRYYKVDSV